MNLFKLRIAGVLWLAGTLLIHAMLLWNIRDSIAEGYPDFTIYYSAGVIVRRGLGHELYDPTRQLEVQREFAPGVKIRTGALPFNHPPFEALLFVPLSYLSYRGACWLWFAVNLAILALFPALLRSHVPLLDSLPGPFWMLACFAFFPVFIALLQGQDTILLMLVYVLAFRSLRERRFASVGGWLACGLFKFHLVLPFLALLLIREKGSGRNRRVLYGFLSVAAILAVASVGVVGFRKLMLYPHYVLALEATGAGGAIRISDMPNVRGLLSLIFPGFAHLNWLIALLSAILFLVVAWSARSSESDSRGLVFSLFIFTTVLVSYHALGHDLCILFLPLLLLAHSLPTSRSEAGWARFAILAGAIVLLSSPLDLVLLIRYNRFAWIALAELACLVGLAREIRSRSPEVATQVCG